MKEQSALFFEGIEGEKFKVEIARFDSYEEFERAYDLTHFVDSTDEAQLGVIRVQDTNWSPTSELVEYAKEPKGDFLAFIESIKEGKPIGPIIVERSWLSPVKKDGSVDSNGVKKPGYFVRDGIHRLSAYEYLGYQYIPAVVYKTAKKEAVRDFDNTLSMARFLRLDLKALYDQVKESKEASKDATNTFELLSADRYFEEQPKKILGEPYSTTNAYGRLVTRYKGNLETALANISVEGVVPKGGQDKAVSHPNKAGSILNTVIDKIGSEQDLSKEEQENIETVLSGAAQVKRGKIESLQSFEDTLSKYNPDITQDELKAWIWYQRKQGHYLDESSILDKDNGWSKYVIAQDKEAQYIDQWFKDGIVCYSNGGFVPSVLYYAGNIYQKQADLLTDSFRITNDFGQEFYDRQWEGLEAAKPNKLTLTDEVEENRLMLSPVSDLAKEITISELVDGTQFSRRNLSTRIVERFNENLFNAFIIWMKSIPKDVFKRSNQYEIEYYYLKNRSVARNYDKEEKLRIKENSKAEGERLFALFLSEGITPQDQSKIEHIWNSRFNGYVPVNYFKVPIAFSCSNTFKNKPLFIRPAQREGLGFLAINGSGCIAYDVGVGKTMTGILSIAQAMESGMCKRPLIVVPNQTYKNWLAEIQGVLTKKGAVSLSGVLPQYPVNDLYNLGTKYIAKLKGKDGKVKAVPAYSISVITYEGMRQLGFNEETWNKIGTELYSILNQGNEHSNREQSRLYEKVEDLMGQGVKGSTLNVEDLGFDFLLKDEAHNMKKVFTSVKGRMEAKGEKRAKSRYKINSGQPSSLALKGFMLAQYVLKNNANRNVVLLTATPFTNNPLEIYSMLSLLGFFRKVDRQIANLQGFFNHFIKSSMMLVINAKMKPERKEVVLGFNNLIALQQLIFRFIDYKSGEAANIQRPMKWVLPLTHKMDGDNVIPLKKQEQISTNLQPTATQKELMSELERYITGELSFVDFCRNPSGIEEGDEMSGETVGLDESNMSEEELEGARVLRGISLARQIAFSPYLFSCHHYKQKDITATDFVQSSPKLKYVMECIRTIKEYHDSKGEAMSGQVIYMNAGIQFFPLIAEYLVAELGFESSEIGMIKGGMSSRQKESVKDQFLNGKVKVLLGSKAIKEGINLQTRASVLYNLWLDWNPTDLKQLEGRIWRFGNQYANVRIVLPLIEDSIDTAIFQKLEEKTSRINEIWHRSGAENSLKLEEFNPAELKMGLITNPNVLAEITLMEEREILRDKISGLQSQKNELENVIDAKRDFDIKFPVIEDKVNQLKPQKKDQAPRKTETILNLFRNLLDDQQSGLSYLDQMNYNQVRSAYTILKSAFERILEPRGLSIDFDKEDVIGQIDADIEAIAEEMEQRTGEEAVLKLGKEILKERIAKGYRPRSISDRVQEFARLNSKLLGERMVYQEQVSMDSKEDEGLIVMKEILQESKRIEALMREMERLSKVA